MLKKNRKLPADDLFEKSSMSFGQHLDELRKALVRAFIWLGAGTVVGLLVANHVVTFVRLPLEQAIREFHIDRANYQFEHTNGFAPPPELAAMMRDKGLTPEIIWFDPAELEHGIQKLSTAVENAIDPQNADAASSSDDSRRDDSRAEEDTKDAESSDVEKRGIEVDPWLGVTVNTFERLQPRLDWRAMPTKLYALSSTEPFMIWLKAGLVAGIVIGSPGIFWHLWQFLAAGLYPHERRYVYWYLPLSLLLFLSGVCLAFFVLFRLVLGFLISYTVGLDVEFTPRLYDYMSFALFLPLGFGIAFQMPIVMLGLHRFGVVSVESFIKQWRLAVLAIAFLSMVLTPAEPYSMVGLLIPLTGLYFFGILLCKYMPTGAGLGSPGVDPT